MTPAPSDGPLARLLARQRFGVRPGLERVRELLRRLGDPQDAYRAVLVAGTNGKGSTAAALAAALDAAGVRTARFSSPHLVRVGERFVVAGREADPERLTELAARLEPHLDATEATFFEAVTALACLHFREEGAEVAVMEVGLGGRLDATNALEPELSIVTGVALDHQDVLGHDVGTIAREKAGVLRPGRPALTGARGEALRVIRGEAARLGAELAVLGEDLACDGEALGWEGVRLRLRAFGEELELRSPLVGAHQLRNLALAAAAALRLGVPPAAIRDGVGRARWPGRLERLPHEGRWVVLDGAHNAEAARALGRALEGLEPGGVTLLLGVARDKELGEIAAALLPRARAAFATAARLSPRARPAEEVAAALGPGAVAASPPATALAAALAATPPGGTVVVAGSLYLVGELRPLLTGEDAEAFERWQ